MKLSGNTILITGGSSGIGQALAIALHQAGNTVILAGRNRKALSETAAAHPGMAFEVIDMQDAAAIPGFAKAVAAKFPALNVLINNAGIMAVEDFTADHVDLALSEQIISTNLLGPIRLTGALLPHLAKQKSATVVNVSSGLAFVPLARTPIYSATKAALHSYTQSLRYQLRGTSVEVLELAPPAVATELLPGQSKSPHAMPLDAFISETMDLLKTATEEILVERVKFLRNAEKDGEFGKVFSMLNPS